MKSLLLRNTRKKNDRWFRDLGVIEYTSRMTYKQIRYVAERSFDALPKKLKAYLAEDREMLIEKATRSVINDEPVGKWNIYQAFKLQAQDRYKLSGDMTAEFLYQQFRLQVPNVYHHYYTYVYRLGLSPTEWFREHFELDQADQYQTVIWVELPKKTKGIVYQDLKISFRWAAYNSGQIEAAEMC